MEETQNNKKSRKWNKTKLFFIGLPKVIKIILVSIVIIVIVYLGLINSSIFTSQTKTTKLGLENVGEFVTQTAHLVILKDSEEHRAFFKLFKLPFTESRQIFSYNVKVDASVNFSQISYESNDEKAEFVVKIPHAKIYNVVLDYDSLKVYLDVESLFSRIDLKEHNDVLKAIEEQAIKDAKENKILEAADENAKRLIEGFIKSNKKYKDYNVVYEYV